VLFLGDSVTWGGVFVDQADTYPELFEAGMDSACTLPVEALGYSPDTADGLSRLVDWLAHKESARDEGAEDGGISS
jgi:hypothetical protein